MLNHKKTNNHFTSGYFMDSYEFPLAAGFVILILATIYRIFSPIPNFSPITAIALMAALYFTNRKVSILFPLILMFISDLFLGFHETIPFVYGSILIITLLGQYWHNKIIHSTYTYRFINPLVYAISASFLFFLITNFGVWLMGSLYARTWEGLVSCFVNAIPFYRNAIAGDVLFTYVLYLPILLYNVKKKYSMNFLA